MYFYIYKIVSVFLLSARIFSRALYLSLSLSARLFFRVLIILLLLCVYNFVVDIFFAILLVGRLDVVVNIISTCLLVYRYFELYET